MVDHTIELPFAVNERQLVGNKRNSTTHFINTTPKEQVESDEETSRFVASVEKQTYDIVHLMFICAYSDSIEWNSKLFTYILNCFRLDTVADVYQISLLDAKRIIDEFVSFVDEFMSDSSEEEKQKLSSELRACFQIIAEKTETFYIHNAVPEPFNAWTLFAIDSIVSTFQKFQNEKE